MAGASDQSRISRPATSLRVHLDARFGAPESAASSVNTGVLVVLVLLAAAAIVAAVLRSRHAPGEWPYVLRKPLSPPEQVLFLRLLKVFPEHLVLAQVAVSRLLGVKGTREFRSWQNRIDRLSADFVICTMDSRVLAVIELDDASHDKPARRLADERKDKAFAAAGIRVVRWRASALPDEAAMRAVISIPRPAAVEGAAATVTPAAPMRTPGAPAPGGRAPQ